MNNREQVSPEEQVPEIVVTRDWPFYWVRENDNSGSTYWPSRGLYWFKFMAVRHARLLASRKRRVVSGHIVVWESSNG